MSFERATMRHSNLRHLWSGRWTSCETPAPGADASTRWARAPWGPASGETRTASRDGSCTHG